MTRIDLEVHGQPHPAARPRFARIGNGVRTYPGKGDGPAKARVQAAWNAAGRPTVTGPWSALIVVEVPRPKSHWTTKGRRTALGLPAGGRRQLREDRS